jgi:hypothetical protein
MKGEGGPADIKLTEGIILLNKTKIPCIQIGQPETLRRVRSADHFVIPPKTEMIIEVFVDRFETDDFTKSQDFLIEPHSYFIETHPSMVPFLDKFLIMPALVGQVTGLDSPGLILLVGLTFFTSSLSSTVKSVVG